MIHPSIGRAVTAVTLASAIFVALPTLVARASDAPSATPSVEIASASISEATNSVPAAPVPFAMAETTQGRPGTSRVWIQGKVALSFDEDGGKVAKALATKLMKLHAEGLLRADRILPGRRGKAYVVSLGSEDLIRFEDHFARRQAVPPTTLTLRYVDALRTALGASSMRQQLLRTASRGGYAPHMVGLASWYGGFFNGRKAADGSRFDQTDFTAAHKSLPFGTLLVVTNLKTRLSTVVRVTDRGPYVRGRMLDLSRAAANAIGLLKSGVGRVQVTIFKP